MKRAHTAHKVLGSTSTRDFDSARYFSLDSGRQIPPRPPLRHLASSGDCGGDGSDRVRTKHIARLIFVISLSLLLLCQQYRCKVDGAPNGKWIISIFSPNSQQRKDIPLYESTTVAGNSSTPPAQGWQCIPGTVRERNMETSSSASAAVALLLRPLRPTLSREWTGSGGPDSRRYLEHIKCLCVCGG